MQYISAALSAQGRASSGQSLSSQSAHHTVLDYKAIQLLAFYGAIILILNQLCFAATML